LSLEGLVESVDEDVVFLLIGQDLAMRNEAQKLFLVVSHGT
jgi:hypothetical protein